MKKFKVIRDRESLSSSEINSRMNFDDFISGYTPATHILFSVKSMVIFGVSTVFVGIVAVVLMRSPLIERTALTEAFVAPPIAQFNIPSNNLMVSGNRDTVISYPGGTKLFIPAGAFIRGDNNVANGPFRISFREFHDQVDQLLSGIPMLYDSAGVKKQFESAGMFDIRVYENNLPVFIKAGKELVVDMPCSNFDNDFNVYYLDTIQRNWVYDKDNSENNILITAAIDTLLHRKFQAGFGSMLLPEKADPLLDNLMIDFDKEEFPELALFDHVKFQFNDKKIKHNETNTNKTWDDVKITRQDNKHYLVTFVKGKLKQSFVTTPVLDKNDLEKNFEEYDKIRTIRIAKFKNVYDSINALKKRYDAQQIEGLLNSNQRINSLIHQGNFVSAMNDYVTTESLSLMSKQRDVFSRTIFIRRFGSLNFDRPFPYAKAFSGVVINSGSEKEILPKAHYYNGKNNTELDVEKAYLIKRSFNGTYALSKKSISEFPFHDARDFDILVIVTTKKEMLYIKDKELKAKNFSGTDVEFRMHAISQSVRTANDIKSHLDL